MCRTANGLLTGAAARSGKERQRRVIIHSSDQRTGNFWAVPLCAAVENLAVDASVAPPGVLAGEAEDESSQLDRDWWSSL